MKKLLVVLLLTLPTVSSAESDGFFIFVLGNKLFSWIEEKDNLAVFGLSIGYVQGISDTLSIQGHICIPKNSTPNQLKDMAENYLKNNPSKRHYAAADSIGGLYMRTFPCNDLPK